ncbi:MAG: class I SAM-dependent methyltransferase [Anaerolineae bacterium]|nr:class I SAM-dependent methyltransferase [Anaerolineae bacterium]
MSINYTHRAHFQHIASQYRSLRTTDLAPINYIVRQLNGLDEVTAADIGCGTGRYTQKLFEHLREKLEIMYCIDYSASMLMQLRHYLAKDGIRAADTVKASAMTLPLREASLNCIFTFNAVHHFSLRGFLRGTVRTLQDGGYLFIYTRTRKQNSRSVWGRFFPLFASKEKRLYEADELQHAITKIPKLRLQKTRTFQFERKSTLESLSTLAKMRYYSTFDLYSRNELNLALKAFYENLREYFEDVTNIRWVDENSLLVLRKSS